MQKTSVTSFSALEKLDFDVEQTLFTADHITAMERHNKFDRAKTEAHYDANVTNYDGIHERVGYPDPELCAERVLSLVKEQGLNKESVHILDFGCGTGLVGEALAKRGFKNIEGVDISQGMLDAAEAKGVYHELHKAELCQQDDIVDTYPSNLRMRFDFVTCTGLVNHNYMDEGLFQQMLMALKPQGHAVFSAEFSYLGDFWYNDKLDELQKEGRMKPVDAPQVFFKYDKLINGVGRFSKTPVKLFTYKKTEGDSVMVSHRQLKKKLTSMSLSVDSEN